MPRVKRGIQHVKKRRTLKKKVKGFKGGRKNLIKLAKTATIKAGAHAYVGRKQKKRAYRRLWQIRISAAVKKHNLSYSRFIDGLKKNKIAIDRKALADLAANHPKIFEAIVKEVKK